MLANYGIHTEQADLRLHVCVLARKVYVFEPSAALAAVSRRATTDQAGHKTVYTAGILTATGYAIPVAEIDPVYPINVPAGWLNHDLRSNAPIVIHRDMDTSTKGARAERLVMRMWLHGYLSGWIRPLSLQQITAQRDQLKGKDFQAIAPSIQVKCDYAGGQGPDCTGNLFIQLSEVNPFKRF